MQQTRRMLPQEKNWLALKQLTKAGFLVFLGVYVLTLPFYYVLMAVPSGFIDMLLPLEAVACLGASILCFGWAGITVKETIKL